MRAEQLAEEFPTIGLDDSAVAAARFLANRCLPALIVVDHQLHPYAVLPASQVLRFMIPPYVQQDPALAGVVNEKAADQLGASLSGHTVRELLSGSLDELPVVEHDATAMEIAEVMGRMHASLVAVIRGDILLGAVSATRLLEEILPQ